MAYGMRDAWSRDRIVEYQRAQRISALERASVAPFYKSLFQKMGASWQDFVEEENFRRLPVIKKSDLTGGMDQFRCRPPLASDRIVKTSGTTGASLTLPVSSNVEPDQWAVWWRYRGWHGIRRQDLCGLFAATPVISGSKVRRPYRMNYAFNEMRFSIYHISEQSVDAYVNSLNKYRPSWIHGSPKAIALLANCMLKESLTLQYKVHAITVGSENLQPWQTTIVRKAFGVAPKQHYGLVEAVANMSECEAGRLHLDEDFSYVEFVREDPFSVSSLVGTSFSNTAVALLRYSTGDLACVSGLTCECGRSSRVVDSLDGRLSDYVVLPDGRRVASLAGPFHATPNLVAAQIYQAKSGALTVRYVPTREWKAEELLALELRLRLRLGDAIRIDFKEVKQVESTSRGKIKLVVSEYEG